MTIVALVDYGIGNLRSVEKALAAAGAQVQLTSDPETILRAAKVVLPGVGAFGDGMQGLHQRGLVGVVQEIVQRGVPLLGICLGMQLLFETGEEMGTSVGLGLFPGRVLRFPSSRQAGAPRGPKIPQTGWNQFEPTRPHLLLDGLAPGCYAYFNHSYYCVAQEADDILAETEYGLRYCSVVGRGRLYGVQFHPEKSQAVGLQILRNFVEQG